MDERRGLRSIPLNALSDADGNLYWRTIDDGEHECWTRYIRSEFMGMEITPDNDYKAIKALKKSGMSCERVNVCSAATLEVSELALKWLSWFVEESIMDGKVPVWTSNGRSGEKALEIARRALAMLNRDLDGRSIVTSEEAMEALDL